VALGTEPYPVRVRRSSSRLPNDAQKPLEVLERERESARLGAEVLCEEGSASSAQNANT
jgi:hypothetical protein